MREIPDKGHVVPVCIAYTLNQGLTLANQKSRKLGVFTKYLATSLSRFNAMRTRP